MNKRIELIKVINQIILFGTEVKTEGSNISNIKFLFENLQKLYEEVVENNFNESRVIESSKLTARKYIDTVIANFPTLYDKEQDLNKAADIAHVISDLNEVIELIKLKGEEIGFQRLKDLHNHWNNIHIEPLLEYFNKLDVEV